MSAGFWISAYIGSIVLVNWGFSHMPGLELVWSLAVGIITLTERPPMASGESALRL